MSNAEKVRESLVRRVARRRGLMFQKWRRRDVNALDYGVFWIAGPTRMVSCAAGRPGERLSASSRRWSRALNELCDAQ